MTKLLRGDGANSAEYPGLTDALAAAKSGKPSVQISEYRLFVSFVLSRLEKVTSCYSCLAVLFGCSSNSDIRCFLYSDTLTAQGRQHDRELVDSLPLLCYWTV